VHVDFANRYIGGGVIGNGCVQEEIRFVISPELLVSLLVCPLLLDHEALLFVGCERFSNYSGYSKTFRFVSRHIDQTPVYVSGLSTAHTHTPPFALLCSAHSLPPCFVAESSIDHVLQTRVVAMDAENYGSTRESKLWQYAMTRIERELNKAHCAFDLSHLAATPRSFATGYV
jgi:hypothetical protein